MSRAFVALSFVLALSGNGGPPAELPVQVGARVVAGGDGSMRFAWPGSYFETRFRGTGAFIKLDPGAIRFRLLVDGIEQPTSLTKDGILVSNLAAGDHVVRLEMLSESQTGSATLHGIHPLDASPLPPPRRTKAIEFIGDSHSVGYGNTSDTRDCDERKLRETTNTQLAFGPVLARRMDADYRVIAYSGYGVVRNYAGNSPGDNLPERYARAIPGETGAALDAGWRPQLIIVYLGTNDFSTALKPGEQWTDETQLRSDWRNQYVRFVTRLIHSQPQAKLLLMGADGFFADVQKVANAFDGTPGKVKTVNVPAMEMTGCHWHPSLRDHRMLADLLQKEVADIPGL